MEDHFWDHYHLSWQQFIVNIKHKSSALIDPKVGKSSTSSLTSMMTRWGIIKRHIYMYFLLINDIREHFTIGFINQMKKTNDSLFSSSETCAKNSKASKWYNTFIRENGRQISRRFSSFTGKFCRRNSFLGLGGFPWLVPGPVSLPFIKGMSLGMID